MRTKQTTKKPATELNGKSKGKLEDVRSPAPAPTTTQPQLSDNDVHKLKAWLDRADKPFSVTTAPLSKKRKRDTQGWQVQDDLWQDRLSVQYEVKPRDKWESLRRYKKFTVGSESIATGQCIMVEHEEAKDTKIDLANQWKAKVLEVRALDSEHVYIRVAWLNRPEDLSSGRNEYHGKNELIPTNQMDIIDAMSCNGSLDVAHWDDMNDETPAISDEQFFWRQTYDYVNGKTFSKLRFICIDNKPQNPDKMILQCSNKECSQWLHAQCIADQVVQRANGNPTSKSTPKKKSRPKSASCESLAIATASKGGFTAEVFIKGSADVPDSGVHETEIVITDASGDQHSEELRCLKCDSIVDD